MQTLAQPTNVNVYFKNNYNENTGLGGIKTITNKHCICFKNNYSGNSGNSGNSGLGGIKTIGN
jgi:hypothetical protein